MSPRVHFADIAHRRRSAGEAEGDLDQLRSVPTGSLDRANHRVGLNYGAAKVPGGGAAAGPRTWDAGAGGITRPASDLDLGRPPPPNILRPSSASPSTATFATKRGSPPSQNGLFEPPRPSSLAPPRPISRGRVQSAESRMQAQAAPGGAGSVGRHTVGQAKAILVDALNGYDCRLETKLLVLQKLSQEVHEELVMAAKRAPPPSATPDLSDAVRAVKEASRAKAVALAQLQRAVQVQGGDARERTDPSPAWRR